MRLGMRIYHAMLFMLPILLIFSASSSVTQTYHVAFTYPSYTPGFTANQKPYPLSPTNTIYDYNMQNALWLITCPNTPQVPDPLSPQFFTVVGAHLFGGSFLEGNMCQSREAPATYPVTVTLTDTLTDPSPGLPSLSDTSVTVTLSGAAFLYLLNNGYSPEVEDGGNTLLSSDFNTHSYVFDADPLRGQQGIWSWFSVYADLSKLSTSKLSTTVNLETSYVYSAACTYDYTLSSDVSLHSLQNAQIPFNTMQGTPIQIGLLPYLVYDAYINNSEPLNEFNLPLSYDIYSPMNYNSPRGRLEPFTLNSLGLFFANYSGALAYANTNGGLDVDMGQSSNAIGLLAPQALSSSATPTPTPTPTGPTGSGGNCATTDLNCIAAVIHSEDGGSFVSTPTYAIYEIEEMQTLGQKYGFPWEYMYAFLMGQECKACIYEVNPTGAASTPSSPGNCYNYWSYTIFTPGSPECPNIPQNEYGLGSTDYYYDFNMNNDPVASLTNANQQLTAYWVGKNPGSALTTCDFDTFIVGALQYFNPGAPASTYESSASGQLAALFGSNWPQVINEGVSPTASGGCTSPGPAAVSTTSGGSPAFTSTSPYAVQLQQPISISVTPSGYIFVLAGSQTTVYTGEPTSTGESAGCAANSLCNNAYSQLGPQYTGLLGVPYCYGGLNPRGEPATSAEGCWDGVCDGTNPGCTAGDLTLGETKKSGGFDCAGLVFWAAEEAGYDFPSSGASEEYADLFSDHLIASQADTQPGDLVFFSSDGGLTEHHVGICYDSGCTTMIDALETGTDVEFDSVANPYAFARVPVTSSGNPSAGNPLPPASSQVSATGYSLYILRVIPKGYYNLSLYQPDSVPSAGVPIDAFTSNWIKYWNDVVGLQGQDVYLLNTIPITGNPTLSDEKFTPFNISTDSYGDVFISGYVNTDSGTQAALAEIANTLGNGQITTTAVWLCPSGTPPGGADSRICKFQGESTIQGSWPEIAVSPTGAQVYLANPESGIILEYGGGNLQYEGDISLSYDADTPLFSVLSAFDQESEPAVNIIDYLGYGGLYGINANNCNPGSRVACTPADKIMNQIMTDAYISGFIAVGANSDHTYDYLDKATYSEPGSKGNDNYHHPIGITDVNGYLYVLDYWAGKTGEICTQPFDLSFGITGIYKCVSDAPDTGLDFGILMLRVINSSGVDVPINPTNYDDLWYCANKECAVDYKFPEPSGTYNPPFGWVLSASIDASGSSAHDGNSPPYYVTSGDFGPTLNLCSDLIDQPDLNAAAGGIGKVSDCLGPDPSYKGTYLPIGPMQEPWNCNDDLLGVEFGCGTWPMVAGFAVNANYTVAIDIPGWWTLAHVLSPNHEYANLYEGVILANLDPQNYTKQIGYNEYPSISYKCYTDWDPESSDYGGPCTYNYDIGNTYPPIYPLQNPFEFTENIGGYQVLALDAIFSSQFGGSAGIGSYTGNCTITEGNRTCVTNAVANATLASRASEFSRGYNVNNNNGQLANLQAYATTLNSVISGYTILPFSYDFSGIWYVSGITPIPDATSCPLSNVPALTADATPQPFSQTLYTYSASSVQNSISQLAQVESGSTYAKSALNATYYYQANLTAISLPPTLFYNLLTNRMFGKMYVNSTVSPKGNQQEIVNATDQYSYDSVTYIQNHGLFPGYETATALATPTLYGAAQAKYLANINNVYSVKNTFSVLAQSPQLVVLFNWFKLPVDNLYMALQLNGSGTRGEDAYGYHRLVYVYNDRFNNTFYMPLDVDIANITQINLSVSPNVNSINVNQTTLYINGTASWTVPFTTNTVPLRNGYIYLYYNTNLDTIGFNAVDDPIDAATCAFSDKTPPSTLINSTDCEYANPVWNGLQYNPNLAMPTYIPPGAFRGGRAL